MLIDFSSDDQVIADCDVCVVGAGPVGIALAIALEDRGLSVLLVESGGEHPDSVTAQLSAGHFVNPRHAPTEIAICRALGGTSRWWGGRCVPFDDADFVPRPGRRTSAWPLEHADITRWYAAAAEFFGIAPNRFATPAGAWTAFGDIRCDQLERWTPEIDAGKRHRARLARSSRITVLLGATVTAIALADDGRRVTGLCIADGKRRTTITPPTVVLACGGLESTRLLLQLRKARPDLLGGSSGVLGRGYMGHLSGKIADIVLADPSAIAVHDFFLDHGVFARRRLTVTADALCRHGLRNIAFWIDNPAFRAADHGNGVLSLVWLALAFPWLGRRLVAEGVRLNHVGRGPHAWLRHVWNVARSPLSTVRNLARILIDRLWAKPRKPGFLLPSRSGRYALHYMAEQSARSASRIDLSDRTDALGLPYLDIHLHYHRDDAQSVLLAHELLDRNLRQAGLGRLEYHCGRNERLASVLAQACDGYHQIGSTRMGGVPATSVVDADCRVHGIENLHVASSAVLPTSGQANPTFVTVALALRLAAHLACKIQRGRLGVAA
ncbi:FAD-dependent oxidoreductase [Bradyrhizobium sp. HKCCYLS3077]|uniref:FAD-dependent oxidoreductase n=1 Tax=Bradyrhizobium sp. HKCCYLS3077 TaxID=3420761 RepID=UPI003EBC3040